MVRTKLKMNTDLKEAFSQVKPVCDGLMVCPSLDTLSSFTASVSELKKEVVQELQQYLLYPLISRIKCAEIRRRIEMHLKLLDAMRIVLEKITLNSYEMYMKLETGLLNILFDPLKPGMVSEATEEVKYSTLRCLTVLMLHIPHEFRLRVLKTQVPMLAQAIFVCVHIAKLERLRVLRVAALDCVSAHTMTHPQLTEGYRIADPELELLAIDNLMGGILPGLLSGLQDVCACPHNPTHTVISAAIETMHRIVCTPMHNKYMVRKPITTGDFVTMLKERKAKCDTEVSNKGQKHQREAPRSKEWFAVASEKIHIIIKELVVLRSYDHFKVRQELAVLCYRVLSECNTTMLESVPLCLDVVISLCSDEYPEVSNYCSGALGAYFASEPPHARARVMDSVCDNFVALLQTFPRVMNCVDENKKLSSLNLLHGYMELLTAERPQRLTAAVSNASNMQLLCAALCAAAAHDTRVVSLATPHSYHELATGSPVECGWSRLSSLCARGRSRLAAVCSLLGGAACAELVLDVMLARFQADRAPETLFVLNWMISSAESTPSMARRIIYAYIEQDAWAPPLELRAAERAPAGWSSERVPDLYEGAVETRYTDIPYSVARVAPKRDPRYCSSLAEAQRNLVLSCLLTEGVGLVARRLKEGYDNYLLKTLCPVMERVGSEYSLLRLAGLKAIHEIARACGHASVGELICFNADYFTTQVTVRLKKAWNCQSALKILSVVMHYSDSSIADCLYGIVSDVLVQSCDKYYESELASFLQTFLACVNCIHKWYPPARPEQPPPAPRRPLDLLAEVREYVKDTQEAERLLSETDYDKSGLGAEDMSGEVREEQAAAEEQHDDDPDTKKSHRPQHLCVVVSVLQRCVQFVTLARARSAVLALDVLRAGLPLLAACDDDLLPLVHRAWPPLVHSFQTQDPVVLRSALDLLVTLAALAKDFIHNRTVKEILPSLLKFVSSSAADSYLKDAGSAYRSSGAYRLQCAALGALGPLARDLGLAGPPLRDACAAVCPYLSNRQPRPLQGLAVSFFKVILEYEYPAAWFHLREFCNNDEELFPPYSPYIALETVRGSPYTHNKEYDANIKLIFDFMVS